MMDIGKVATDKKQLIYEFLDSRRPKNEHEHAAAWEIIRLRLVVEQLRKVVVECLDDDMVALANGYGALSEDTKEMAEKAISEIQ